MNIDDKIVLCKRLRIILPLLVPFVVFFHYYGGSATRNLPPWSDWIGVGILLIAPFQLTVRIRQLEKEKDTSV